MTNVHRVEYIQVVIKMLVRRHAGDHDSLGGAWQPWSSALHVPAVCTSPTCSITPSSIDLCGRVMHLESGDETSGGQNTSDSDVGLVGGTGVSWRSNWRCAGWWSVGAGSSWGWWHHGRVDVWVVWSRWHNWADRCGWYCGGAVRQSA